MRNRKRFVIFGLFILLALMPIRAFSQEVVSFFAAPGQGAVTGLTWDGQSLWSASVFPESSVIYQLDTLGNMISQFQFPGVVSGLGWDGQYLWLSKALDSKLYKVDKSGTQQLMLSTSLGDVADLTWDGSHLWVIDRVSETINKLDSTGKILAAFGTPTNSGNPDGLTWDGNSFWFCDGFYNKIFQVTSSGGVLQEFTGPGLASTELEWEGKHLWVSDIVTDRIYKLKVSPVEQIVQARIELRPSNWPKAWGNADLKPNCGNSDDADEAEVESETDLASWTEFGPANHDTEKLACIRKISCFLGNLRLDSVSFDVGDILIETVRLNDTVSVLKKKECGDQHNDKRLFAAASPASGPADQCFQARIYRHWDQFDGAVLRVKFDATEAFKTFGPVGHGDTVKVCVTGMLKNGLKFSGCAQVIIVGEHPTSVTPQDNPTLPKKFGLIGNFPNPFNASTTVRFELSRPSMVELTVYNILGQKVKILLEQTLNQGQNQVIWDGTDDSGKQMGTGIYFYRLRTAEGSQTGKMTMLK